jgi:hypothetical protein
LKRSFAWVLPCPSLCCKYHQGTQNLSKPNSSLVLSQTK